MCRLWGNAPTRQRPNGLETFEDSEFWYLCAEGSTTSPAPSLTQFLQANFEHATCGKTIEGKGCNDCGKIATAKFDYSTGDPIGGGDLSDCIEACSDLCVDNVLCFE
jgi:hypothetical protein